MLLDVSQCLYFSSDLQLRKLKRCKRKETTQLRRQELFQILATFPFQPADFIQKERTIPNMSLSVPTADYLRRRRHSDLASDVSTISTTSSKAIALARVAENHSDPFSGTATKSHQSFGNLVTRHESYRSPSDKNSTKKQPDSPRKTNGSPHKQPTPNPSSHHSGQLDLPQTRGRSNTDVQIPPSLSNNLKYQQSSMVGFGSDRTVNQHSSSQAAARSKKKCTLPVIAPGQPGYVSPSKLFNMMAYGLQNQYLFMLAHYLYIIDCRTREEFEENHIITAIHWEDALNGTVYISVVERFSELVLYDNQGLVSNIPPEMARVSSRFQKAGSKICLTLSGGFEAFQNLFPFVCTQSDIRTTVDREKFLTIYPSVILDNQLYLGTGNQATNWKVVRDLKITHVINISFEHPCMFTEKIKYLHLQLEDMEDVLLKDRFDETIRFMTTAFQNSSGRVLVHCNLGISRSTTVTLAYLMKTYNATAAEAIKFVRNRRPIVCPNSGFVRQLLEYEVELFGHTYSDPKDPIFH